MTAAAGRPAPLGVGRVLARTFAIWGRDFVPFTIIGLLVEAPLIALVVWSPAMTPRAYYHFGIAIQVAPFVLSTVTAGGLAFGVIQQLRGKHAPFGDCLVTGVSSFLRIVRVAVFVWLQIGVLAVGALFVTGMVIILILERSDGPSTFAVPLIVFIAALIPAFAVLCRSCLAVPAAVMERIGVGDAIRRSAFLTRGSRFRIFCIVALLILLGALVAIVVRKVVPARELDFLDHVERFRAARVRHVAGLVASGVLAGLVAVATSVVYYELRTRKESVDIEQIAAVFS